MLPPSDPAPPGPAVGPGRDRRETLPAYLILASGLLLLLGGILFGSRVLGDSDVLAYYYPLKSVIRSLWRSGQSLSWNPFLAEGQRLAGNPEHELFYPFTWLLFFLPVARALAITQAFHLAAGWLGMRKLLRRLGSSETAAVLGAVGWGFGGLWISSMQFLPVFLAWTWIPHLAAGAADGPRDARAAARDSFFGALILLIGEPVTALCGALAYLAVFLQTPATLARWRRVALTAALSLGIAAAVILPGAALARVSPRWSGIDAPRAAAKSFPIPRLAEFLVPRATGNVVPRLDTEYFGWRLYPERGWPFYLGLYGGVLLAPLALASVLSGFRRNRSLIAVGALAFLLSLGPAGGLWEALRAFRFWRGIRYPEKFVALFVFMAVVLMARGFDAATASTRVRRRVAAWLLSIGALLGAAAVLPGLWTPLLEKAIPNAGGVFPLVALRAAAAHLLFGAFFALRDGRLRRAPVLWALLAAVSIDVLSSTRDFIRTRPVAEMEKEPPVASVLRRLEPVPRVVDLLPDEPPQPVPGADEIDGPWDRNRVLGEQLVQWGIPLALDADYDLTNMAASDRARSLLSRLAAQDPAAFGELLAQRSACALLVWKRPIKLEDPVGIARVRDCRPEIDSASAILRFRGDEEFLRVARENKGRLARAVFVEDGADEAAPPPGEASLSEISSRTDRLSFRAECASPCFVRVARTNDGRWKALLDGRPVPVLTANLSLIGLPIPAGSHQVEIRYEDELLRASIGVSAAALLFAAAIVILGGRRRSWIPARRTGSGSPTGARRP